jgi:hypothetical protein
MYPGRNYKLTTLEEDFRKIGLLPPEKKLQEVDDSTEPRDIPSPDPSTMGGGSGNDDSQATPARHKYAKQPKPKMAPDEKDDHDDPLEAGATQGGKSAGSYKKVAGGKEASLENVNYPQGYQTLKDKVMARAKDKGKTPAVAQGLEPTKSIAGMGKKHESQNVSRAAELVGEVEALLQGSQMGEDLNNLAHGFTLIGENCSLLASRLVDIAEHYNVDDAISEMEQLYDSAVEACSIIESAEEEEEVDVDGLKEAFRVMTLSLMDAVEMYDATLVEMSKEDDDKDDDDDDDDKKDDDDDDDDDDDKDDDGGMAARMAKLKAMKGKKGPFGK